MNATIKIERKEKVEELKRMYIGIELLCAVVSELLTLTVVEKYVAGRIGENMLKFTNDEGTIQYRSIFFISLFGSKCFFI